MTARRRSVPGRDIARPSAGEMARFLAEASHELRGGAARLALMAEALADQAVNAAGSGGDALLPPRLAALATEGRRVQALASALLDVVQLTEEGRRLDPVPVRVDVVLDEVLAGEVPRADQRVEVDVGAGLAVLADPLALDQILSNLIRNAYHHGGPAVTIAGWLDGDRVTLAVADDGPGLPEEQARHLFAPYRRGPGAGLGLRIAAQLVALLHGDIAYEANEPSGARFVVRLPAAPGPKVG